MTQSVLEEIGGETIPSRLILNKIDKLTTRELEELHREFPDRLFISAHDPEDIATLRKKISMRSLYRPQALRNIPHLFFDLGNQFLMLIIIRYVTDISLSIIPSFLIYKFNPNFFQEVIFRNAIWINTYRNSIC